MIGDLYVNINNDGFYFSKGPVKLIDVRSNVERIETILKENILFSPTESGIGVDSINNDFAPVYLSYIAINCAKKWTVETKTKKDIDSIVSRIYYLAGIKVFFWNLTLYSIYVIARISLLTVSAVKGSIDCLEALLKEYPAVGWAVAHELVGHQRSDKVQLLTLLLKMIVEQRVPRSVWDKVLLKCVLGMDLDAVLRVIVLSRNVDALEWLLSAGYTFTDAEIMSGLSLILGASNKKPSDLAIVRKFIEWNNQWKNCPKILPDLLNNPDLSDQKYIEAEMLIQSGYDVNTVHDDETAVAVAYRTQQVKWARLLIALGAETHVKDKNGIDLLTHSVAHQNEDLRAMVVKHKLA